MQSLRYKYRRPTHPGKIIREDIIPALAVSIAALSKQTGLPKKVLVELINERIPVTADMAVKLARVMGSTPSGWLNLQHAVDLWDVEYGGLSKQELKKLSNEFKRKSKLKTA